jgi:hypothetical protein
LVVVGNTVQSTAESPSGKLAARQPAGLFSNITFAEPNPRPTPVFLYEFDAGTSKYSFNYSHRLGIASVTTNLNIGDGIAVNAGRFGQITNGPI